MSWKAHSLTSLCIIQRICGAVCTLLHHHVKADLKLLKVVQVSFCSMVIHFIPYDASYVSLPTTTVPIASRAPTIDKTNGSLLLTFARGTRGEIDCFVMSESLFTIDWFLDGWPIRDQLFETEYQVLVQYNCVSVHDTTCYCMCLLYSFSVRVRMFPPPKTPPHF